MHILSEMAQEDLVLLRQSVDAMVALQERGFTFNENKWLESLGIDQGETFEEIYLELRNCTENDI